MESQFVQSSPLQYPLEHFSCAVRFHDTACRARKHILALYLLLFSVLLENLHRFRRQQYLPIGVVRLGCCLLYDAIYSLNLALNLQHPGFKVDVVPLEAEQLAPSQSGGQIEVVEFNPPVSLNSRKKSASF